MAHLTDEIVPRELWLRAAKDAIITAFGGASNLTPIILEGQDTFVRIAGRFFDDEPFTRRDLRELYDALRADYFHTAGHPS